MNTNKTTTKNLYFHEILSDSAAIMFFFFIELLCVAKSLSFPRMNHFISVNSGSSVAKSYKLQRRI